MESPSLEEFKNISGILMTTLFSKNYVNQAQIDRDNAKWSSSLAKRCTGRLIRCEIARRSGTTYVESVAATSIIDANEQSFASRHFDIAKANVIETIEG